MPKYYYQIGEVANMLQVKKHTLRYWENEFPQLKPRKNSSGKRSYTMDDIELLKKIIFLLYKQNYSIEGARKKLAAARKNNEQMEFPGFTKTDPQIKNKLKGRLEKIQDFIEVTPKMDTKIQKKTEAINKLKRALHLLNVKQ